MRGQRRGATVGEGAQSLENNTGACLADDMEPATTSVIAMRRGLNLALATWVSTINFWAWNMIGPLSTTYARDIHLNSAQASMLVATPILVG